VVIDGAHTPKSVTLVGTPLRICTVPREYCCSAAPSIRIPKPWRGSWSPIFHDYYHHPGVTFKKSDPPSVYLHFLSVESAWTPYDTARTGYPEGHRTPRKPGDGKRGTHPGHRVLLFSLDCPGVTGKSGEPEWAPRDGFPGFIAKPGEAGTPEAPRFLDR